MFAARKETCGDRTRLIGLLWFFFKKVKEEEVYMRKEMADVKEAFSYAWGKFPPRLA